MDNLHGQIMEVNTMDGPVYKQKPIGVDLLKVPNLNFSHSTFGSCLQR